MRDLVLASQYKDSIITFATQNLKGNINEKIIEAGYTIHNLESNDKKELTKLIKVLKIDLLVIDHYKIDCKIEKYIKKKTAVKILALDDTYKKHHCDILLNHNLGADKKKYLKLIPKKCKLKCGSKYTLLRDEFHKQKKKNYKKKDIRTSIFVAMGGIDSKNLNIKILKVLLKFKNIKINLITTNANKNLKKLKKFTQNKETVNLHINSKNIAKIMRKSDFAIITPSVTANETYFMELPFIAIQTASNQKDIFNYLEKLNALILNKFNASQLTNKIKKMLKKL